MRFSAEQAFEASESGDPIIISENFACEILRDHGLTIYQYISDLPNYDESKINAADLLAWLGY